MTSVFVPGVEVIEWPHDPHTDRVVTIAGRVDGLPVFTWRGSATGAPSWLGLRTQRQLTAAGLRPGGADPVAVLRFRHRHTGRRVELAELFLTHTAAPRRIAAPGQMAGCYRAHRTCRRCGEVGPRYVPRRSRMCLTCENVTNFYETYEIEHYGQEVAA